MATIIIPARNDLPAYKFKITLDAVVYTLDFNFNSRSQLWNMSISDQSENLIIGDIPILTDTPLTDQYVVDGIPPGRFIALDETGKHRSANKNNLGTEIKIFYQEAADNV